MRPWTLIALALTLAVSRPAATAPNAEPTASRDATFRYQGANVAFTVAGSGPQAVVLVHGWAADRHSWGDAVPRLRFAGQVAAVDLVGHGESDVPEIEYSLETLSGCVLALLDELGATEAILVGHSAGVPVCRDALRRAPDRIQGLVLVDGPLRDVLPTGMAQAMLERFRSPDYRQTIERMRAYQTPNGELTQAQIDAIVAAALATQQSVLLGTFTGQLVDGYWKMDPIDVPVLAIYARNRQWSAWTDEYLDFVRTLAPRSEVLVWENSSHLAHLERATEFRRRVEEFASRVLHQGR